MTIQLRTAFFISLGLFLLWFLYIERDILTPFILAGIFAYIFNPIVNFFNVHLKIPRSASTVIIYVLLMGIIVLLSIMTTHRIMQESTQMRKFIVDSIKTTKGQVDTLPDWIESFVNDTLVSIEKSKFFSPAHLVSLFPAAVSRIINFLIFIFASFYFLKSGRTIFDKFLNYIPNEYKIEVEILLRKINSVLAGYLRGQIFLVFLVSLILYIALSILGVKFALILAIFSGFAEIIPILGPIVATTVTTIVVMVTGTANFGLLPIQAGIIVIIIYFVVRQIQDYFITPHVMGRITKLHPLVILFAVISGGHLYGILGLILAVPVAATIKIFLEYFFDKIHVHQQKIS